MMNETRVAKLFKNGASQAVRLPAGFRFEGDEVYVTRDDATGDVVLSNRPGPKLGASSSNYCRKSMYPPISWRSAR